MMRPPGSWVGNWDRVCDLCGAVVDRNVVKRHRGRGRCRAIKEVQKLLADGWCNINDARTGKLVAGAKVPRKKAPKPIFNKKGVAVRDGATIGTWVPRWVMLIIKLARKEHPIGHYHDTEAMLVRAKRNLEYRKAQTALAICIGVSA